MISSHCTSPRSPKDDRPTARVISTEFRPNQAADKTGGPVAQEPKIAKAAKAGFTNGNSGPRSTSICKLVQTISARPR